MDDILIVLQSLIEERENQERFVASVGNHNTTPQSLDVNCPLLHNSQGVMVPQTMYPTNRV